MAQQTSAAQPQALLHYADQAGRLNRQLRRLIEPLRADLREFARSCEEFGIHRQINEWLADELRNYLEYVEPEDQWVCQVGNDFADADMLENFRGALQWSRGYYDHLLDLRVFRLLPDSSTPEGKIAELKRLAGLSEADRARELRKLTAALDRSKLVPGWRGAHIRGDTLNAVLDEALGPLRPDQLKSLKSPADAVSKGLWAVNAGLAGFENWQQYRNDSNPDLRVEKTVVATAYDTAVSAIGTGLGTAGGAAVGSVFGPVGATIGGRLGGIAGGMAADWLSKTSAGKKVKALVVNEGAEILDNEVDMVKQDVADIKQGLKTIKGWLS